MSELQWKKKNSHDYVSNSDLWIKDASFNMQKMVGNCMML